MNLFFENVMDNQEIQYVYLKEQLWKIEQTLYDLQKQVQSKVNTDKIKDLDVRIDYIEKNKLNKETFNDLKKEIMKINYLVIWSVIAQILLATFNSAWWNIW